MPSSFDFILLGNYVSIANFLEAIETEIGLFVELRGAVGIWWNAGMLDC